MEEMDVESKVVSQNCMSSLTSPIIRVNQATSCDSCGSRDSRNSFRSSINNDIGQAILVRMPPITRGFSQNEQIFAVESSGMFHEQERESELRLLSEIIVELEGANMDGLDRSNSQKLKEHNAAEFEARLEPVITTKMVSSQNVESRTCSQEIALARAPFRQQSHMGRVRASSETMVDNQGPACRRCRNHGFRVVWKGHKRHCPFKYSFLFMFRSPL